METRDLVDHRPISTPQFHPSRDIESSQSQGVSHQRGVTNSDSTHDLQSLHPTESPRGTPSLPSASTSVESLDGKAVIARQRGPKTKIIRCKYYSTKKGCRAGETCPFLHDAGLSKGPQQGSKDKVLPEPTGTAVVQDEGGANNSQSKTAASLSRPNVVRKTQVMSKPISNAEKSNPREFQLSQIRRRFTPSEKTDEQNAAILSFKMKPSDPDFPFELEALLCTLIVPANYPHGANGKPRLRVTNPEMERGYQINVERGFDALISKSPGKTLLALMNDLERNLESYLIPEKAQTIKLISNAHQTEAAARPAVRAPVATPTSSSPPTLVASKPVKQPVLPVRPSPSYTASQRAEAEARRTAHLRQLEARMGRQQMFSKASDGVTFTVPIVPKSPSLLPVSLQTVKAVKLVVPMSYNLEPSRIEMVGVERGAEALRVEKAFEKRAQDNPDMNLMTQLNLLGVNMHMMAKEEQKTPSTPVPTPTEPEMISIARMRSRTPPPESSGFGEFDNDDRSHVKIIPRPPEWNQHHHDSPDDNDEDTYSDTYDSEADVTGSEDEDGGVNVLVNETEPAPERGVLLSFPFLELYGIELLELTSLSLTVKCDRCKDMKDIKNLRSRSAEQANVKNESCNKCASLLSVGYRKDLMHVSSVKAGYLDLDGCTVVDLLPSNFIPTCSECSTAFPEPGVASVRGESRMVKCRECHKNMNFKLPEVKFLIVSNTGVRANRALPRRRKKENLGITAGSELPRKGRCNHYAKSYRWFRFTGCCDKVYPCDRCHDEKEDHVNEHAGRMLCGFCSREQPYRPENCIHCHSILIGKKGSGFWEGGHGTRNRLLMSRKDPRKHKRVGGSFVGHSASGGNKGKK